MLFIRTDMNENIATGHVMRCLSIADAAKKLGERVTFLLSDEQGREYIESRGHATIVLNTAWNHLEGELPIMKKIIAEHQIRALLVDSYYATPQYLKTMSAYTKVIYIDDFANECYPVSAIVCYMSHWRTLRHKERYAQTKLMLGLEYAPVRAVFSNIEKKKISANVESILLLSGGADQKGALLKLLDMLKNYEFKEIVVICGRFYGQSEQLTEQYREYQNIHILKDVDNIETYMQKADLAISAGGTTLYELCACGTPTISYSFVDNQLENVKGFAAEGIIEYAGDIRCDNVFDNIRMLVEKYCDNRELREACSEKMRQAVDGNGAYRIVREWMELPEELK